jgi:hypothetical protein
MKEISKQMNIRKFNLISSSEELQDNSEKCQKEINYLSMWYKKYFNILESEFSSTKEFHSTQDLSWNGLMEDISKESYVAILWKLFTSNIRVLGEFISKESFEYFVKFLLKRIHMIQQSSKKDLFLSSRYDVNNATQSLLKRKAFFDLTVPRDCIFTSVLSDVSKNVSSIFSMFKDSEEMNQIKTFFGKFESYVGKDSQIELKNVNAMLQFYPGKFKIKKELDQSLVNIGCVNV